MPLTEVKGNLLDSKEQYICHQTNCFTNTAAGLAKDLFKRFYYADTYSDRAQCSAPGTIDILGNGEDKRYIINMNAQINPGHPNSKFGRSTEDTQPQRLGYFSSCLK